MKRKPLRHALHAPARRGRGGGGRTQARVLPRAPRPSSLRPRTSPPVFFFRTPPLLTRPVLVLFAFSVRAGKGVYSSEFEGRLAELRRTLG